MKLIDSSNLFKNTFPIFFILYDIFFPDIFALSNFCSLLFFQYYNDLDFFMQTKNKHGWANMVTTTHRMKWNDTDIIVRTKELIFIFVNRYHLISYIIE